MSKVSLTEAKLFRRDVYPPTIWAFILEARPCKEASIYIIYFVIPLAYCTQVNMFYRVWLGQYNWLFLVWLSLFYGKKSDEIIKEAL